MKWCFAAVMLFACLVVEIRSENSKPEIVFRSSFDYHPHKYLTEVTRDILAASIQWTPTSSNPPLPVGQAVAKAKEGARRIFKSVDTYVLSTVMLRAIDDEKGFWLYEVELMAIPPEGSAGLPPWVKVIVLMDGNVVTPHRIP